MRRLSAPVCISCVPKPLLAVLPAAAPEAHPASADAARPAAIPAGRLSPWHDVDPRWEREADVVFVGVQSEDMTRTS